MAAGRSRNGGGAGRSAGFTLIEVLVVLLIVGLLAGLVSVNARPDERGILRLEAERLAQLLELAAMESRFGGKTIAWTAGGAGYLFWRGTADAEWSELRDNDLLRARTLPRGMSISGLRIENLPVQGPMRLEFAPYGPALSFSIELSLGDAHLTVAASPIGELRVVPDAGESIGGLALQ